MLIINADDWGLNKSATDRCLSCYKNDRITSASAMMFMADSERAAELALENNLDTGLHVNFTAEFSGRVNSSRLNECHGSIIAFLSRSQHSALLYNPLLKRQFDYVYKMQYEEYTRLYGKLPTHIDGHHHMHICTNMIIDRIIPKGSRVRRNYSFEPGRIKFHNRVYRHIAATWLRRYYSCTDFFFDIKPIFQPGRLLKILNFAKSSTVELMVHPEIEGEYNYLMSEKFLDMISGVEKGTYFNLEKVDRLHHCST